MDRWQHFARFAAALLSSQRVVAPPGDQSLVRVTSGGGGELDGISVPRSAVRTPWPAGQMWPAAHFRVARMAVSKFSAKFLRWLKFKLGFHIIIV